VSLELGGTQAMVVLPHADLALAADGSMDEAIDVVNESEYGVSAAIDNRPPVEGGA
jgi:acyl-CoA reductase-like NAD-dependent aldehyde dehydrogenase